MAKNEETLKPYNPNDLKERVKKLKDNDAVVIYSGKEEFIFWNSENARILISGWDLSMPNYYSVDKFTSDSVTVVDNHLPRAVKTRIFIDRISEHIFRITEQKITRNKEVVAEKVRTPVSMSLSDSLNGIGFAVSIGYKVEIERIGYNTTQFTLSKNGGTLSQALPDDHLTDFRIESLIDFMVVNIDKPGKEASNG